MFRSREDRRGASTHVLDAPPRICAHDTADPWPCVAAGPLECRSFASPASPAPSSSPRSSAARSSTPWPPRRRPRHGRPRPRRPPHRSAAATGPAAEYCATYRGGVRQGSLGVTEDALEGRPRRRPSPTRSTRRSPTATWPRPPGTGSRHGSRPSTADGCKLLAGAGAADRQGVARRARRGPGRPRRGREGARPAVRRRQGRAQVRQEPQGPRDHAEGRLRDR